MDKTIDLLYGKYLKAKISYEGVRRVERYPFPEAAVREAVVNAIAHKNYASGAPIQIRVYDDKISIADTCVLPQGWGVEDLLGPHASEPHNPKVASAFFLAGLVESWGRGVQKIFTEYFPEDSQTYVAAETWIQGALANPNGGIEVVEAAIQRADRRRWESDLRDLAFNREVS